MGAAKVGTEVPEPASPPHVSRPLLISQGNGGSGPPEPVLDEKIKASADVSVFFEVYGETEPEVYAQIAPRSAAGAVSEDSMAEAADMRSLGMEPLELDVYFTREPESRILKAWLPVPAGLEQGAYQIEVRVAEPGGEGEQVFELSLQIEV
jgi:hypothetical protein